MRVHGTTCFCPVSAIAHHHGPTFGAASHARIAGFSPLLRDSYPRPSQRCEKRRRFRPFLSGPFAGRSGGATHECAHTHGSHTRSERPCPRSLF